MKKPILMGGLVIAITSCEKMKEINPFEKKDKHEKVCPTVSSETLPSSVVTTFNQKYAGATTITWFDKDGSSYCVVFTLNGKETKALFSKDGVFQSEEIEQDNHGDHQDNESGCECETNHEEND